MTRFCVFTPTYNRAHTLPKLYESLKQQTFKDFVWSVTDDGSTDNTQELIQGYIDEGVINIKYRKVPNAGKTRAVVNGAKEADAELFICLDSDDWLTSDALETLNKVWMEHKDDNSIAGMVALKGYLDGSIVGNGMPRGLLRANVYDLYYKYGHKGDLLHAYRTELFNKYPAPVADGEKFMSEGWTITKIAQQYDVIIIDKVLHIGDYLSDGLSKNVIKLTKDNPIGYYRMKDLYCRVAKTPYQRLLNSALYDLGCILAKRKGYIREAARPGYALLGWLPAQIFARTRYR